MPDAHPRTRRTAVLATVAGLLAAPLTILAPAAPASAAPQTITLLNINDFHGRIQAASEDEGEWSGTTAWAARIEQLRAAAPGGPASTALLSAGDNIGASLYASSSQEDRPTIDVLNAMDLAATAVGNHEFDKGFDDLEGRVTQRSEYPQLGANVYAKGTTTPALPEFEVIDVNGVDVGVVGVVTQETPALVSPDGVADLDFGEPVAAVNRVAAKLKDGNPANGEADVVVAEYHEGGSLAAPATIAQQKAASAVFKRIAEQTSRDVSVIFNGHTHQPYAYVDGGRPIVQTGSYGANIGQVTLSVDPDTGAVTSPTAAVVGATTTVDPQTLEATFPRVGEVRALVEAAETEADRLGAARVGATTATITRAKTADGGEDRGSESTLGGLVGNALRDTLAPQRLGGAEIGVVNPGGLRDDLPAGTVTARDANEVLPFANNLNTITLTGAQFKTLLEQQWQRDAAGEVPSRAYLQLGLSDNVSYTSDPSRPEGDRITSISVDGAPIVPTRGYRIGTFSFLQAGGDNFRVFREGTNPQDSGLVDFDGWVDYLGKNDPVAPSYARRSTVVTGLPATAAPGSKVSFAVSRLDLTSDGSPTNTSLRVGYQAAGSSTVTPIGTTTVSNGAARVTATVPASSRGSGTFVLTAAPSGTVVRVPVTIAKATPTVRATGDRVNYGNTPKIKVRVSSTPQATGVVQVTRRGSLLGRARLSNGTATVSLRRSALKPGTHPVSVTYLGDGAVKRKSTKTTVRVKRGGAIVDARVTTDRVVVDRTRARLVADVEARTGVTVRGTVRVKQGSRTVGTGRVRADGRAVIRLDRFARTGRTTLRVTYLGSSTVRAKTDVVRITVRRR